LTVPVVENSKKQASATHHNGVFPLAAKRRRVQHNATVCCGQRGASAAYCNNMLQQKGDLRNTLQS